MFPTWNATAACATDTGRALVDACYDRPGHATPERADLTRLCRSCPLATACFEWAMTHPEWGVWAGTSPWERTHHGAPAPKPRDSVDSERRTLTA